MCKLAAYNASDASPKACNLVTDSKKTTLTVVEEARTKQSQKCLDAYAFCNLCGQSLFGKGFEGGHQGSLMLENGNIVAVFVVSLGWKIRGKKDKIQM